MKINWKNKEIRNKKGLWRIAIFLQILTKKRLLFKLQALSFYRSFSIPTQCWRELLVQREGSFYFPRRPECHKIAIQIRSLMSLMNHLHKQQCTTGGHPRLDFGNSLCQNQHLWKTKKPLLLSKSNYDFLMKINFLSKLILLDFKVLPFSTIFLISNLSGSKLLVNVHEIVFN